MFQKYKCLYTKANVVMNLSVCENEMIFYQYRSLLTQHQWNLLTAIAKEEKLFQPYSQEFLFKHQLVASNIKRSIESLVEKGMVFYHSNMEIPYYEVQDKFLMLWLKYK